MFLEASYFFINHPLSGANFESGFALKPVEHSGVYVGRVLVEPLLVVKRTHRGHNDAALLMFQSVQYGHKGLSIPFVNLLKCDPLALSGPYHKPFFLPVEFNTAFKAPKLRPHELVRFNRFKLLSYLLVHTRHYVDCPHKLHFL